MNHIAEVVSTAQSFIFPYHSGWLQYFALQSKSNPALKHVCYCLGMRYLSCNIVVLLCKNLMCLLFCILEEESAEKNRYE